jgi:hypothetical protein
MDEKPKTQEDVDSIIKRNAISVSYDPDTNGDTEFLEDVMDLIEIHNIEFPKPKKENNG